MPTRSAASASHRYEQIVAELRKIVEAQSRGQFAIGDYALEIEPMHEQGPPERGEELFTVKHSLFRLAEDIGLSYSQAKRSSPVICCGGPPSSPKSAKRTG